MSEARNTPNVVFIVTDQQRYDSMGCTGNPFAVTPNLDALASSVETVARTMGTVSSSFGTPGVGLSATDPIPDAISPIRLVHSEYWDL